MVSPWFYTEVTAVAGTSVPLDPDHEERAIYVVDGEVEIANERYEGPRLLIFRPGDRITVKALKADADDVSRRRRAGRAAPHLVEFRLLQQGADRAGQAGLENRPLRARFRRNMSSFRCRNRLMRFPVAPPARLAWLQVRAKVRPMTTMLSSDLPLPKIGRGKVRDIYAVDDDRLLLLTTDRISAFDVVMGETIPMKGAVLTQISAFWFNELEGVVPHHMISADADEIIAAVPALKAASRRHPRPRHAVPAHDSVSDRMRDPRLSLRLGLEGICRLRHAGGREAEGRASSKAKSSSPRSSARRPRPRPAMTRTSRSRGCARSSATTTAYTLESMTRAIYTLGEELAREQGIIIADTKFEFGRDKDGRIILIDEVMTPDSLALLGRRCLQARPAAGELRQAAAARLSRRRAPRRPLERRRPAAAAARERGRRDQQAVSRSVSAGDGERS